MVTLLMIIQEFFHVFEMRIGRTEFDHRILALLKQQRERPEKFRPERGFEPDLCDADAVLYQLSFSGQLGAGRYVGRL